MFGHYCYGIQGPTVLFMYNPNLHNLQNDAETTTTDYICKGANTILSRV